VRGCEGERRGGEVDGDELGGGRSGVGNPRGISLADAATIF
jgi:hypothetical protein